MESKMNTDTETGTDLNSDRDMNMDTNMVMDTDEHVTNGLNKLVKKLTKFENVYSLGAGNIRNTREPKTKNFGEFSKIP